MLLLKLAKRHLHGWRPLKIQVSFQLCLCFALHSVNMLAVWSIPHSIVMLNL
jgi:hypothetical protein